MFPQIDGCIRHFPGVGSFAKLLLKEYLCREKGSLLYSQHSIGTVWEIFHHFYMGDVRFALMLGLTYVCLQGKTSVSLDG